MEVGALSHHAKDARPPGGLGRLEQVCWYQISTQCHFWQKKKRKHGHAIKGDHLGCAKTQSFWKILEWHARHHFWFCARRDIIWYNSGMPTPFSPFPLLPFSL